MIVAAFNLPVLTVSKRLPQILFRCPTNIELFRSLRHLCKAVKGEGVLDDFVTSQRKLSLQTHLKKPVLGEVDALVTQIGEDRMFGLSL